MPRAARHHILFTHGLVLHIDAPLNWAGFKAVKRACQQFAAARPHHNSVNGAALYGCHWRLSTEEAVPSYTLSGCYSSFRVISRNYCSLCDQPEMKIVTARKESSVSITAWTALAINNS